MHAWFRRYRTALVIVSAAVIVIAFTVLVWLGPRWLDASGLKALTPVQRETAIDAIRGRMIQIGAGLLASGALVYTALNFRLSRENHVTDRYTKAIEQLGSDRLDIRLGAIYALERIMIDSPRDHPTIVEVLAAFVREHSRPLTTQQENAEEETPEHLFPESETDVRAAATVLGRRPTGRQERGLIDLSGAYLVRANLMGVRLSCVILKNAYLAGSNLSGADLGFASLTCAELPGAVLTDADLTYAKVDSANLKRAKLIGADLAGANLNCSTMCAADLTRANLANVLAPSVDLTGADLTFTNLAGADLGNADLTGASVARANMTGAKLGGIKLPGGTWKNPTIPDQFRPPQQAE